jgi:SAM-dependent methyltransferase
VENRPVPGDYVLGTHDEEVARLGVQHRVWRARVLEVWQRAGFGPGQTIVDLGCGPGYATLDLAAIVGPAGRVVAIDRSRRFLNVLERAAAEQGHANIAVLEGDLDTLDLAPEMADGIWCRWVAAFVNRPRDLVGQIHQALKPGGRFVSHEYFEYGTWRLAPPSDEIDTFVRLVIQSWRDAGGEPNVGLELPSWLEERGLGIASLRPIIDIIDPASPTWQWPRAFIETGLARLTDLGKIDRAAADRIWRTFLERESLPHTRMITPGVLEIVAVKPAA